MRCKHVYILLVIREQFHHKLYKNELFFVLSKKRHTVRLLYNNDCSCIFFEKKFTL